MVEVRGFKCALQSKRCLISFSTSSSGKSYTICNIPNEYWFTK
jgi:hypothetical protein